MPEETAVKTSNPRAQSSVAEKPVWTTEAKTAYEKHKQAQREWRAEQQRKRVADLEAGPQKFNVALLAKDHDGVPIRGAIQKVLHLGTPVDSLVVGGTTSSEAKEKFCRYNGIPGVPSNVIVV
jgi:O-glycosyl hydrolase